MANAPDRDTAGSPGPGGQPTLDAVAALAGVSRTTASRVLNDSPRVSPAAKLSVEQAIAALHFVPNRAARSLASRRTDSIALVISEPEDRFFGDPFFATIVRGVGRALARTDLQLILATEGSADDHRRLERYLQRGDVDGVLFVSSRRGDQTPVRIAATGVPTVLCGRLDSALDIPYVDSDSRGGARVVVEHLLGRGRRRIATIAGPQDMAAGNDRLAGYRDGLPPGAPERVADGDFTAEGGAAAMTSLLAAHPDLDAVFAASDVMALGALRVLRGAGRRVPDDVALVGWDDIEPARHADPPLTTVRQPVHDMAAEMIRLLLLAMQGEPVPDRVVLPVELVERASA